MFKLSMKQDLVAYTKSNDIKLVITGDPRGASSSVDKRVSHWTVCCV